MKKPALVRTPAHQTNGRHSRRPVTAAVLLTALCLASACATVAPGPPPIQTLLAYWDANPLEPLCPAGEECVAGFGSLKELENQIRRQRRLGLELVDFDSGPASETTNRYVGAWVTSATQHVFHAGLDWSRFLKDQQALSRRGYRLISLTVYATPTGSQRVAGIWWPDPGAGAASDRIVHDLDRSRFEAINKRNAELNGPEGSSIDGTIVQAPFALREVVVFYSEALSTHLGVVHDGGTSGPPGG